MEVVQTETMGNRNHYQEVWWETQAQTEEIYFNPRPWRIYRAINREVKKEVRKAKESSNVSVTP